MSKPGRKSAAELATVIDIADRSPAPPPRYLTAKQREIWINTLKPLPSDWIGLQSHALLEAYVRHVSWLDQLNTQIEASWDDDEKLARLLKMAQAQTRIIAACGRALRLNPASVLHPRYSGARTSSRVNRSPSASVPWAQS